jgi:molybdopterin/thiamine biosynthesis adenylyltransferase
VDPYPVRVEPANASAIVEGHGLVLDCSRDPATGETLDEACAALRVALIRARTDESDPNGAAAIHSGPLAGIAGARAALEAIGLLAGTAPRMETVR